MLTIEDVQKAITEIEDLSDNEMAHVKEDELHQRVLRAIAEGKCKNTKECARLALTTLDLDYTRWYA